MARKNEPTPEAARLMIVVGSLLARHRCYANFKQAEVAVAMKCSIATIANSEMGRQWLPLPTIAALLKLYGVSLFSFFNRVEKELL